MAGHPTAARAAKKGRWAADRAVPCAGARGRMDSRMAKTPAYEKFIASMTITQEMWHDGIGYDTDALRLASAEERAGLVSRLTACGDWRDVEALAEIARIS